MEEVENKDVKTKRQMLAERMAGKYPDSNFDDDDALYGAVMDDFDNYDQRISRSDEIDRTMADKFTNNPKFGGLFLDVLGDTDPVVAMIERYGEDIREYLDDPDKREELAEANKKYIDRINKEKELEAEYDANLQESLKVADEVQQAGGYSDEQVNEAFNLILMDANNAIIGKIDAVTLETKLKGLSHEADLAEATQQAEVRGKNAKIEEKKKSLRPDEGMPAVLQGKGSAPKPPVRKEIAALDRVAPNKDVWGGMKRYN